MDKPVAARMADDPRYRSSRTERQSRSPAASAPQPDNDPLVELARLIGQDDFFPAVGREPTRGHDGRARPGAEAPNWLSRPNAPHRDELGRDEGKLLRDRFADIEEMLGRRGGPSRSAEPAQGRAPVPDPQDRRDEAADGPPLSARRSSQRHYEEPAQDQWSANAARNDEDNGDPYRMAAYDGRYDAADGTGEYVAEPGDHDSSHEDDYQAYDAYDDTQPSRRPTRLAMVLGVVGLAILGTAAAFGYRAITGGSGSEVPPIIKANTDPAKVMASGQAADGQGGKQIYDRVDKPQASGEQMLPREEEPVNLPPRPTATRSMFPPPAPFPPPPNSAPQPPALIGGTTPSAAEPRKVHTIPIRQDQGPDPMAQNAQPDPGSQGRPFATAAAAPATTGSVPNSNAPRQQPQAKNQKPAPAGSPGPLAINSADDNAVSPVQSRFPAMPPAAATVPVAPPARAASLPSDAGHYVVQVSSQRNEADAQSSFKALQQKYPSVLGNQQPIIRRADLGDKGIYYRAQVGPFATLDEANQLCSSLKAAGGQCIVQRN